MPFLGQTSLPVSSPDLLLSYTCDASVYVGAWVYLDAAGIIQNAIATSAALSNVVGIIESKPSATGCIVRIGGATRDLFVGLVRNAPYFLSTTVAGEMTTTIATAPGHVVLRLGTPMSDKKMLVAPQMRMVRS